MICLVQSQIDYEELKANCSYIVDIRSLNLLFNFLFTIGCYQISTLSTNQSTRSLMVNNNSVGACYWQCKMNALKKSLCENTTGIQFGLQVSLEFLLALVAKDILIRVVINFLNSLILFYFMKV